MRADIKSYWTRSGDRLFVKTPFCKAARGLVKGIDKGASWDPGRKAWKLKADALNQVRLTEMLGDADKGNPVLARIPNTSTILAVYEPEGGASIRIYKSLYVIANRFDHEATVKTYATSAGTRPVGAGFKNIDDYWLAWMPKSLAEHMGFEIVRNDSDSGDGNGGDAPPQTLGRARRKKRVAPADDRSPMEVILDTMKEGNIRMIDIARELAKTATNTTQDSK